MILRNLHHLRHRVVVVLSGMTKRTPILERAFQLAGDGRCRDWEDVVEALKGEGYEMADQHFSGSLLRSQINKVCDRGL